MGNNYSEDKVLHNFEDNLQKGGRGYSYKIDTHQEEFRRVEKIFDQKSLSLSALQIYYLDLNKFYHSRCSKYE